MNNTKNSTSCNYISALQLNPEDSDQALLSAGVSEKNLRLTRNALDNYSCMPVMVVREILAALLSSNAASQGLLRFERFLENAESSIKIETCSGSLSFILSTVFKISGALSVRLSAVPRIAVYLAGLPAPFAPQSDPGYYRGEYREWRGPNGSGQERITAVHLMHTAQLIRICARNADPGIPIQEISQELSSLADAVIGICLSIAADDVFSVRGTNPVAHSLFILGLGKLGGQELNVSSDIDLLYLTDSYDGWESFESMTLHTSLTERLTQILTEATPLGYLYRVDTRLRADGASGPLVRTAGDYFRYLEMRGQAWERQMLLKARPISGNIEAGRRFLKTLESFIFPVGITRSPNREIVFLKNQIESRLVAEGSKKTHLKLMPGGIRDIEFIAQCLQLLTGGKHPEVRQYGTLPALRELHGIQALSDSEQATLSSAYVFYRRIENALQWHELLPAFTIPETGEELSRLECELSLPDLNRKIVHHREQVRAIYRDVFSAGGESSPEELAVRAALNPQGDEQAIRFLGNLGFVNPEESAKDLSNLVSGYSGATSEQSLTPSLERFLPRFLQALSKLPDPGIALSNFRRIVSGYAARTMLFDIMEWNQRFFDFLLTISQGSLFMTDLLSQDPSLLDWLIESEELMNPLDEQELRKNLSQADTTALDDIAFSRNCLRIKNIQKLRIGARDLMGITGTIETLRELTRLAEYIFEAVYRRARRVFINNYPEIEELSFCVLTAGKLGAEQMDFGSDLDLIFVYESRDSGTGHRGIPQNAQLFAQSILNLLEGGGVHRIYEVDARLRPEGGRSPLAVSFDEYRRYLAARASVWERLAMVRARTLAGDPDLGERALAEITRFIYRGPLTPEEIAGIVNIREKRIENSSKRSQGLTNIKSGRGGIADLDFVIQAYACHFGGAHPHIRSRRTMDLLDALDTSGLISHHEVQTLRDVYQFLVSVEKAIRIGSGKAVNTLPPSGPELARVARLMKFRNIRQFTNRLKDILILGEELFQRLMRELPVSGDVSSERK